MRLHVVDTGHPRRRRTPWRTTMRATSKPCGSKTETSVKIPVPVCSATRNCGRPNRTTVMIRWQTVRQISIAESS